MLRNGQDGSRARLEPELAVAVDDDEAVDELLAVRDLRRRRRGERGVSDPDTNDGVGDVP